VAYELTLVSHFFIYPVLSSKRMAAAFRIFFYLIVTCLSALLMYSYIMTNSNAEDYYDVNISKLKSIIATMVDELVPFDIHEFKILSWKLEFTKSAKNITTGYLSTIFQEQLFAFAMIGSEGKRILRVESQQKSFSLFEEEGNTKVFLSEELIGTIGGDNIFTSLDGNCTYTISQALSDTVTISSKDEEIFYNSIEKVKQ